MSVISVIKQLTSDNIEGYHNRNHSTYQPGAFVIILWILLLITGLITMVSSAIVAYKCNHRENMFVKICILLFALFFSEFYVPYYLIKYVILDRKCGSNVFIRNTTAPNNNKRRKR